MEILHNEKGYYIILASLCEFIEYQAVAVDLLDFSC